MSESSSTARPARSSAPNLDEATKMLDQEHVTRLTEEVFRKLSNYTRSELLVVAEDCQLLETMNKMTREKYTQMSEMSQRLMDEMSKVQNTYADFGHFTAQIDAISQQAIQMEKTAIALDEYSRHLENKLQLRPA
ncbi:biogenesis of lysosome-related organelles complex-1 subunit 2-domain-containing protein [Phycomyces nitens]|nr:biogenesis of lysosome-related organelles complex-1 subunit 2-domain-containing protein [Phycomyces nitens]